MRQKEAVGAFFKVPIDHTYHTYGRIIMDNKFAFYDYKTDKDELDLDKIEQAKVLFKILVSEIPIKKGIWKIIGIKELPEDLKEPVPLFIQEIGNPKVCYIDLRGDRRQVSPEECIGVERFAAWSYQNVEQRLADHYNGVPNVSSRLLQVEL
ncbi:immunity 26/phosphotriesterase HocA family protein [Mucilaginibacter gossypii]|uniref:immunity 26/phosphotriesterase HocA family protein n=1 Tax=Mucilaginibacter gossypii TaxID=551996 RepID=UPI000DCBEDCB|nr:MULTISPECIES: immunity 26/phosphotriesterase HocA family protein [Mucilaginibacter]QTE36359.1 immunity 26/phosphotriesterase HocA family protein [Mucilaginibacter gossypii]RAV55856.1 hypothetical protein DIU36_16190 [Mucilaginibacter rubeus]